MFEMLASLVAFTLIILSIYMLFMRPTTPQEQQDVVVEQKIIAEQQSEITALRQQVQEYEYMIDGFIVGGSEVNLNSNDITQPSGISVEKMKLILDGTGLDGLAYAYVYAERVFGINALYMYAITANESAYGTSRLAVEKNNISGFAAYDHAPFSSAKTFDSKTECVIASALNLKTNYVKAGLVSLDDVNSKYATDSQWASKVNQIAKTARGMVE